MNAEPKSCPYPESAIIERKVDALLIAHGIPTNVVSINPGAIDEDRLKLVLTKKSVMQFLKYIIITISIGSILALMKYGGI